MIITTPAEKLLNMRKYVRGALVTEGGKPIPGGTLPVGPPTSYPLMNNPKTQDLQSHPQSPGMFMGHTQ